MCIRDRDYTEPIDVTELKAYLDTDSDFKYATVVHCDTPSGMLNDVEAICPLLKEYGCLLYTSKNYCDNNNRNRIKRCTRNAYTCGNKHIRKLSGKVICGKGTGKKARQCYGNLYGRKEFCRLRCELFKPVSYTHLYIHQNHIP